MVAVLFLFSISTPASAAVIDVIVPETSTYSFTNPDGTQFHIETTKHLGNITVNVFINNILAQVSTGSEFSNIITTNIYDTNGHLLSSESISIDNMVSISPLPTGASIAAIVPAPPTGGYPNRSINDEPVENSGLMYSFTDNGKQYYYLGSGTDSFAPDIVARLFRTYTSTYIGETHFFRWDVTLTVGAIIAYLSFFTQPLVSAIIGLLVFTATGVLAYEQSVELETYTFDYHYQVTVNTTTYYTASRNITYWKLKNTETNVVKWEQKTFNHGFSMGNQEMIRMGIEAYCAAN